MYEITTKKNFYNNLIPWVKKVDLYVMKEELESVAKDSMVLKEP
jgi:hypothetical protein